MSSKSKRRQKIVSAKIPQPENARFANVEARCLPGGQQTGRKKLQVLGLIIGNNSLKGEWHLCIVLLLA